MLLTGPRTYLHVFFILAFILAGVSPACKFISGQVNFIEICGFDGIKTVAVETTPDDSSHTKMAQDDCAFCFAHVNVKGAVAASVVLVTAPDVTQDNYISLASTLSGHHTQSLFQPRAPPVLL